MTGSTINEYLGITEERFNELGGKAAMVLMSSPLKSAAILKIDSDQNMTLREKLVTSFLTGGFAEGLGL